MISVCFPFVGDSVGGNQRSVTTLIKGLPDDVMPYVVLFQKGIMADFLDQQRVDYTVLDNCSYVQEGSFLQECWSIWKVSGNLSRFLTDNKIDIVHCGDIRMNLSWGLAAKKAGAKFIWHQRSAVDSRRLDLYSRLADRILTISNFCKSSFPEGMKSRAEVIWNPVEVPENVQSSRQDMLDLFDTPVRYLVTFIGNFTKQKRPQVFIEMAALLSEKFGDEIGFVMIGSCKDPKPFQDLIAEQGLTGKCQLLGFQNPIENWIAGSDLMVCPGLREGFGRVVGEAMKIGTPVVATNEGGHCEIVQNGMTGYLVEKDNIEDFAEAVIQAIGNLDNLEQIRAEAQSFANRAFSAKRYVIRICDIYRILVR